MVKNQNNIEYIVLDNLLKDNIQTLLKYYPEWSNIAIEVNNILNTYIDNVYRVYLENRVKKSTTIIDKKYRKAVYNVHEIFLKNRDNGIKTNITFTDVCRTIRSYDTAYLFSILLKKL
jgi:hypothetical protein